MSPYLKDWKREGFYHNEDKGGFFDNFKEEYLHFFFGVTHPKNTSLKCSMDECVNKKAVALKGKSLKLLLNDFCPIKYEFFDYENFNWFENWHKIVTTSIYDKENYGKELSYALLSSETKGGEVGLMCLPRIYFQLKLDDHYKALQEFNKNKN